MRSFIVVEKILHYTYLVDFSMDKLILRFPKIACRYCAVQHNSSCTGKTESESDSLSK